MIYYLSWIYPNMYRLIFFNDLRPTTVSINVFYYFFIIHICFSIENKNDSVMFNEVKRI